MLLLNHSIFIFFVFHQHVHYNLPVDVIRGIDEVVLPYVGHVVPKSRWHDKPQIMPVVLGNSKTTRNMENLGSCLFV